MTDAETTATLKKAIGRVTAYLDAHQFVLGDLDQIAEAGTPDRSWARLTVTDLRLVLAAADPDEQPIAHIPTKAGLDYLALRKQQHPKGA